MIVVSLIPKNNALCHGFIDGARAAEDAVQKFAADRAARNEAAHLEAPGSVVVVGAPA